MKRWEETKRERQNKEKTQENNIWTTNTKENKPKEKKWDIKKIKETAEKILGDAKRYKMRR